jgi:hypothetical protein
MMTSFLIDQLILPNPGSALLRMDQLHFFNQV